MPKLTPPPEIRKACLILGVRPEELTKQGVIDAWQRQVSHPNLGCNSEAALFLNNAKTSLIKWLENHPGPGSEPHQPTWVPLKPPPDLGGTGVILPFPPPKQDEDA